jgi:opacity protein-like surface antigen
MTKNIVLILLCSALLLSSALSYADEDNKFYIGISGGISTPLKDKFKVVAKDELTDQDKTVTTGIKKSYMATVNLGYRIAKGSAVEFSIDIKPKFDMNVVLFDNLGSSKTKASANVYMVNFVYDLLALKKLTPYFIAGIGIADIKLKPATITSPLNQSITIFKLTKNHRKALAFQAGLGATYPISQTIKLDISAKIHAIKDVKIKYQKLDTLKMQVVDKSTKQHLGMFELTAGLVFNF